LLAISYNSSGVRQIVIVKVNATSITSAIAGIKGYKVKFCKAGYSVICKVNCKVASYIS
jgi:hypothetical protein